MLTVTVPATTIDLTVLETLKSDLGLVQAVTTDDAYLSDIIHQASSAIATYCGRSGFGQETLVQTERLHCRKACIVLDRDLAPVIASVVADGTTLTAGTDYELDGSVLYRLSGSRRCTWYSCVIVITYTAGYGLLTTTPYDLERACLDVCRTWWAARGRDPALRSEELLDISKRQWFDPSKTAPSVGGLPQDIAQRLDAYRLSF